MKRFYGIGLRTISYNTFFQLLARIAGSITTLLATLIIASFMGYPAIGSFVKVTEFVLAFYLIIEFGFTPVFQRIYKDKISEKIGNLILLKLLITLSLIPIIFLITFLLPESTSSGGGFSQVEKNGIIIFSLTLISFAIYNTLLGFLQYHLSTRLALPATLASSITVLAFVYFAARSSNFSLLFFSFIASGVVYTLVLFFIIKKNFNLHLMVSRLSTFSANLFKEAWPLGTVFLINYLYARLDIFLLSLLKPTVDVGIYGISYRFFDVAIAIPALLASSTYPLLLNVMDNHKIYRSHFKKYLLFYGFVSALGTAAVFILSPIIQLLRPEFLLSVAPLRILSLFLPFFFLTSLLQWHFVIRRKILILVPVYATVLLLNLILNIIFIPHYSYFASAIITGLCEVIVFLLLFFFFIKHKVA